MDSSSSFSSQPRSFLFLLEPIRASTENACALELRAAADRLLSLISLKNPTRRSEGTRRGRQKQQKKTRTLSPSVRPTPRSTNYYTTTTKKCTRQCFLFFTARRAKKKNPSPSVHKVYNPNCDLETPRRTCGGRLCHPRAPARVRSSP